MISIAKPELLLAALKGPELACLLALQFAEGPAKVIWLGQVTGLGEHSLTQALDKLLALGLARHDGRRSGWQLAPSLRRLLLEREKGQLSLGECMADPLPARREGNLPADRAAKRGAAGDPGLPPPPAEPTSNLTPAAKRGASKDRVPLPIPGDPAPDLPPAAKRGAAKDAELLLSPGDPVPDLPPAAKRGAAQEFDTPPAQPAGDQRLAPGGGGQGDTLTGLNRAPVAAYERHPAAAIRGGSQPSFGIDTEEVKVGGGINNLSPPALTYLTTCAAPRSDAALVGDVLAASRMLFGETVHGPPARYPDVALLLAHLAEVYNRRQTLRTPARVVYANLEKGVRPAETYCRAPLDYLPVDFLEAAGLARPARLAGAEPGRVGVAESAANTAEDAESLEEGIRLFAHSQYTSQYPSLDLPVSTGSERSAREAWSIARAALQHMIPLAVYAETVELLRLSRFESEGCVFVVASPDPSRIEWLKQRLSRLLERALTGACAQEAKVLFVGDS